MVPPTKHPLATPWTFYYEPGAQATPRGARQKRWVDTLTKLPSFSHAEDYWALHRTLPPPSLLRGGSVYLFRSDLGPPCWESWPEGGKWVIAVTGGADVDELWQRLCVALLGEQLEGSEGVCGGVCNAGRLAVWVRSAATLHDEDIATSITSLLKLPPDAEVPIFAVHRRPPVSRTVSVEGSPGSPDER